MESRPQLQGILLMSKKEIEEGEEKLRVKTMLQFAYAHNLKFLEDDEGSTFEMFTGRYAKAFGDLINDHPEIRDEYKKLMIEGNESTFDFEKLKVAIKPYLPRLH